MQVLFPLLPHAIVLNIAQFRSDGSRRKPPPSTMHGWLAKMRGTLLGNEDLRSKVRHTSPAPCSHPFRYPSRACAKCATLAPTSGPRGRRHPHASLFPAETPGRLLSLARSILSRGLLRAGHNTALLALIASWAGLRLADRPSSPPALPILGAHREPPGSRLIPHHSAGRVVDECVQVIHAACSLVVHYFFGLI
jgi:hypothetical protein